VKQDTNRVGNIYDARVCEPDSPCIKPAEGETAQCSGGNCQTPAPAPVDQTPASETFSGADNLTGELVSAPPPKRETAAQIRAKKLAAALKVCKKAKKKTKRAACERVAHKKYGPVKTAKKASKAKRATSDRRTGR